MNLFLGVCGTYDFYGNSNAISEVNNGTFCVWNSDAYGSIAGSALNQNTFVSQKRSKIIS